MAMFQWDDVEQLSFEDSDRFEEDSICSWISEPESVVTNWRGWRKQSSAAQLLAAAATATAAAAETGGGNGSTDPQPRVAKKDMATTVFSLSELAAREVASSLPFELVEIYQPPVPEQLQLRIAYWSFPEDEEDIRLYSCLANGSSDEFNKGENLFISKAVKEPLQIGFHLSATICPSTGRQGQSHTSVTFDRRKIVSCQCSCNSQADWCAHVVALCLHRILMPTSVRLRAPVSESLSRLERDQLRKFAQYLIARLPEQILPVAQKILDDLLSQAETDINTVAGAPDPTLVGAAGEQVSFCLDAKNLKDNIRKILIKFCVPAPIVLSDVNCLSSSAPPSASEWCSFLRPLRGREPEGMWNLLSIVREMYRRNDRNSIPLLEIVTQQCLEMSQIMVWWFVTKVALQQKSGGGSNKHSNVNSNTQASQNACASLCDEIVTLWKLAALNPCISPAERKILKQRLVQYHMAVVEKVQANHTGGGSNGVQQNGGGRSAATAAGGGTQQPRPGKPSDIELFPGFKPAIEACSLDWSDYPIAGVTFGQNSHYLTPFTVFRLKQDDSKPATQVNSSQAVLRCEYPQRPRSANELPAAGGQQEEIAPDEGVCGDEQQLQQLPQQRGEPSKALESSGNEDEEQYKVYFYDTKTPLNHRFSETPEQQQQQSGVDVFRNLRKTIEDPWEVLFMRAEGIHAHGYHLEASSMAVDLANDLLKNPPDLTATNSRIDRENKTESSENGAATATSSNTGAISKNHGKNHHKKSSVKSASHAVTQTASTTLSHCAFLCTVLSEDPAHRHLAFQVGMFGLELTRPPASTKPMEVKLAHQESELVNLLKRIPLGPAEMSVIRERARQLKDGVLRMRGEALLPLMLASYIFESLALSTACNGSADELLGFEAAVAAIGLKASVSEADHPLLCEGTRRQRGDLALLLLTHYKDCPEAVARVMDRLLDREVHPHFKAVVMASYYVCDNRNNSYSGNNQMEALFGRLNLAQAPQVAPLLAQNSPLVQLPLHPPPSLAAQDAAHGWEATAAVAGWAADAAVAAAATASSPGLDAGAAAPSRGGGGGGAGGGGGGGAGGGGSGRSGASGGSNGRASKKGQPQEPQAASGAENSRRSRPGDAANGPGSDSGSSGNSTGGDSVASSGSSAAAAATSTAVTSTAATTSSQEPTRRTQPLQLRPQAPQALQPPPAVPASAATPPAAAANPLMENFLAAVNGAARQQKQQLRMPVAPQMEMSHLTRTTLPNIKVTRYKGKRQYPNIPNHPSEASAHFMFELAKTVLNKAGGSSATSLFTQPPAANQNPCGPHRALHMCAFQIGLYALGLHNRVSHNWLLRTYSSHVSWITGQAMELGASALTFLISTWEYHLTPPEAASVADKASKCRDAAMVRAGASLALSVLPHSSALNPNEIRRAIQQCKEHRNEMLEKACEAVEGAAQSSGGGVYPEVLFEVARHWYDLFKKHQPQVNTAAAAAAAAAAAVAAPGGPMGVEDQPPPTGGDAAAVNQPPQLLALQQDQPPPPPHNVLLSVSSAMAATAQVTSSNFPPVTASHSHLQVTGLPFPAVYSLVPGFPPNQALAAAAAAAAQPLMFVTPPPNSAAAAAAAAALQLQAAAATSGGMQARYGQIYSLGVAAPLLPAPPPTTPLQAAHHHAAAIMAAVSPASGGAAAPTAAPSAVQAPPPQQPPPTPPPVAAAAGVGPQQQPVAAAAISSAAHKYLMSAYRVAMLALENLGRRIAEDRPQAKYAKTPSYAEDVKWLHSVAQKLGLAYVEKFFLFAMRSIQSPFVLQELVWECGAFLASATTGLPPSSVQFNTVVHHIRTQPYLSNLLHRCFQAYYDCLMHRLLHLTPNDYDEFISILMTAKQTFMWSLDGTSVWHSVVHAIKRSKSCKKELWQKIVVQNQQSGMDPQPPPL